MRFAISNLQLVKVVKAVAPVIVISLVAALVLSTPDQIIEIYRMLVGPQYMRQLIFAAISMLLATRSIWWTSATLLNHVNSTQKWYSRSLTGLVPGLVALILPASTFIGIARAAMRPGPPDLPADVVKLNDATTQLHQAAISTTSVSHNLYLLASVGSGLSILLVLIWTIRLFEPRQAALRLLNPISYVLGAGATPDLRQLPAVAILSAFVASICILLFAWEPYSVQISQSLGTLAIINVFVAIFAVLVGALYSIRLSYGIPAISFLVLLSLLFSFVNWNDNHRLDFKTLSTPKNVEAMEAAFTDWLHSRGDRPYFKDQKRPYPVFVISAAGGGIYAASITAQFLARLQDRCPNFAQHVFAISSVSGGSMGAALFSSLAAKHADNSEWQPCVSKEKSAGVLEAKATSFFENDFLAPIAGATLFPDFFQQFVPLGVALFDRSKAFDANLEATWDKLGERSPNPFRQNFLEQWKADGAVPALVINSFEVESGNRMLISPFFMSYTASEGEEWTKVSWLYDEPTFDKGTRISPREDQWWEDAPPVTKDIKLSTAVGLSARFPWILPAAVLQQSGRNIRLVDGSYFENSGAETGYDIVQLLNDMKKQPSTMDTDDANFEIYFIAITSDEYYPDLTWQGLAEILSPIRGLLASRTSRGGLAAWRAVANLTDNACEAGVIDCLLIPLKADRVLLNPQDMRLPLGFVQSDLSTKVIAAFAGEPDDCDSSYEHFLGSLKKVDQSAARRSLRSIDGNNCVACAVEYQLKGLNHARGKLMCAAD
jgi:hypothetical protein